MEQKIRPHADTAYWLEPNEVVSRTVKVISHQTGWKEMDVFRHRPGFGSSYYLDVKRIRKKWYQEMHGKAGTRNLDQNRSSRHKKR